MNVNEPPEDDSDNFTDEEIRTAVPTSNLEDFNTKVLGVIRLSCSSCGRATTQTAAKLLRRKPNLFSRWSFKCESGHATSHLFQVDWIKGPT